MQPVVKGIAVLAVAAVAILALLWMAQRRLIYFPTRSVPSSQGVIPNVEEVVYETDDGLTLSAWFMPLDQDPNASTVVIFPGNAGNRMDRVPLAQGLHGQGFSVLLVEYRGYGGNPGEPSETGLASDARAALDYLKSRGDVDPDRLVYFGESLGAGVAIELARHHTPSGLVLRSPFTSLSDVGSVHYPFLPMSLLLRDRYLNMEAIRDVDTPTLIIAGSADRTVPIEQSRRLFDAALGPKRFVVVEGADHNDASLTTGSLLMDEVQSFLSEVSSQPQAD